MDSKTFLTAELKKIYNSIEGVFIKYEYRQSVSAHIIEVLPESIYSSNNEYIEMEILLTDSFLRKFPTEDIVFVTEESIVQIETVDIEFKGWRITYNSSILEEFTELKCELDSNLLNNNNNKFAA